MAPGSMAGRVNPSVWATRPAPGRVQGRHYLCLDDKSIIASTPCFSLFSLHLQLGFPADSRLANSHHFGKFVVCPLCSPSPTAERNGESRLGSGDCLIAEPVTSKCPPPQEIHPGPLSARFSAVPVVLLSPVRYSAVRDRQGPCCPTVHATQFHQTRMRAPR